MLTTLEAREYATTRPALGLLSFFVASKMKNEKTGGQILGCNDLRLSGDVKKGGKWADRDCLEGSPFAT